MKSSLSIRHWLHNVKSTVKISSIFVAFLENMNFKAVTIIFDLQFPWSSLIFPICKINKVDFDKYSTTQLTLMHTYLNFYAK